MITKLLLVLKRWALPLVIIYAIALTIGSLMHLKDMPSLGSSFDDKIYHLVAYIIFTFLVYNFCVTKKYSNVIFISAITVTIYGIIIEVLQFVLTSHRTFDFYDALANASGAIFAAVLLKYQHKLKLN